MTCTCQPQQPIDDAQPDEGSYSNGTVFDFSTGVMGIVEPGVPPVVVRANDPNREVLVKLEEGYPNALTGLNSGDSVFCAVSAERIYPIDVNGIIRVDATCFYVIKFGAGSIAEIAVENLVSSVSNRNAEHITTVRASMEAINTGVSASTLPPVCVIAYIKAIADPAVQAKIVEFIDQGYFPYETDCMPAPTLGVVNVIIRFRNGFGSERALLIPVRLRTWSEATSIVSAVMGAGVTEIAASRGCDWRCKLCRVACRAAQAGCIAACPASGPAAIVCAAGCAAAGEVCYSRC